MDYLSVLDDQDVLARSRERIERIRSAMTFPYPVVELLPSNRRRAVTAVVAHPEFGECVCKLFYPSASRFFARELRARTDFAAVPEVPALLASGENRLLSPRYADTGAHVRRRLPGVRQVQLTPSASVAMAGLAEALHEKGAFLLDLSPLNLLSDPEAGLKVIDWEFLQDFPGALPALQESPTVLGHADGLPGVDSPLGVSTGSAPSITVFNPMVSGLPPRMLLSGPRPLAPIAAVAEIGLVLGWLRRGLRTAARDGLRFSAKSARKAVRGAVVRVERRRSAASG